jgi:uncharacterized protein (TIGR00369 family)
MSAKEAAQMGVAEAMDARDWEAVTANTREHVPVHEFIGLTVLGHEPNTAVLTMDLTERVKGSAEGTVHGGLLATLADVASAYSVWGTYDFAVEIPVTTDMHIRYYRQPAAGPVRAEANVVHRGRRLLSVECSVTDARDRVLARSTATYMVVPQGG